MADDNVNLGRFMVRLTRALERPTAVLKRIGVLITSRTQRRFGEQKDPDGTEWPARWTPNVPGIIDDLQRGASIKSNRFEDRPVLLDYGRLRQSIQWQLRSMQEVEIGTNIGYGADHQFGMERQIAVGPKVHAGLLAFFQTAQGRPWEPMLNWLLDVDNIQFTLVKREFIGISDEDAEDIRQIVVDGLIPPGSTSRTVVS